MGSHSSSLLWEKAGEGQQQEPVIEHDTGEEGDEEDSTDEGSNEVDGAGGGQQQEPVIEHDTGEEGDEENSADEESNEVDGAGGEHSADEEGNEVDGARAGIQQVLIVDQMDQSRRPVRGDLIAFVKDNFWVRAKIKSRASDDPNYYNVQLEDGSLIGVFLIPPDGDHQES